MESYGQSVFAPGNGLSDETIAGLAEFRVQQCVICLQKPEIGEVMTLLPCPGGHMFHKACIQSWLKVKTFF